jgi:hypothetical protein
MTIAKPILASVAALILILLAALVGLGVIAAKNDDTTTTGMHAPGRMMQMERSGQMHEMLQNHQEMLDRMRSDASPQMREMMKNDPMTQMMRSGEMIRMQEQHQAEIDRMLGRMPGSR